MEQAYFNFTAAVTIRSDFEAQENSLSLFLLWKANTVSMYAFPQFATLQTRSFSFVLSLY